MALHTGRLAENIRAISAAVGIIVVLAGTFSYFSNHIHAQEQMGRDVVKIDSRVTAIEEVLAKADLDRFRLDREEQDTTKLAQKVEDIQKNVIDMRIMIEKLLVLSARTKK